MFVDAGCRVYCNKVKLNNYLYYKRNLNMRARVEHEFNDAILSRKLGVTFENK